MDERYPEARFHELVKRVSPYELPDGHRRWTGNDASQRNHNGRIPENEKRVFIELWWKRGPGSRARLIGGYRVNLPGLVRQGYLSPDPAGGVRLKFFHGTDGRIYLGRGATLKSIPVGMFPARPVGRRGA